MSGQELTRHDVAVLKRQKDGCCTYCHRAFGSLVTWKHRNRYLEETVDHVVPKAIGGRLTLPSCQICNAIKGSLIFDSLAEIQDYCLDRLLQDKSITAVRAHHLKVERAITAEELTSEDLTTWAMEEGMGVLPTVHLGSYEPSRAAFVMSAVRAKPEKVPYNSSYRPLHRQQKTYDKPGAQHWNMCHKHNRRYSIICVSCSAEEFYSR